MKTSIQFINHASVIIKGTNISLLSDPWYQGDAFHKGWNLLYELSDDQIINIFKSTNVEDKIELLKRNNIQKCIQWCEKNHIIYNKNMIQTNIFTFNVV